MKDTKTDRKRLAVFFAISFGITYLMGLLMWYGYGKNIDLALFPLAQMLYPAAGVIVGILLTAKEDTRMPRRFYTAYLIIAAAMFLLAVLGAVFPAPWWESAANIIVLAGSIVCLALLTMEDREKKEEYGLAGRNGKMSFLIILLFIALYFLRELLGCAITGDNQSLVNAFTNPTTLVFLFYIGVNFFFSFLGFFGEEYGWRYFLQPMLQKKSGLRGGVLLVGVLWGLWHLPLDFFYYSIPEAGLQSVVSHQISCITLGIFFAYAYMKTQNIWVPVVLHFLNNNLVVLMDTEAYSTEITRFQGGEWSELLIMLILSLVVWGGFIFTKPFRARKNAVRKDQ